VVTIQRGVLFAYTWVVDAEPRTVDPVTPVPWPARAAVPPTTNMTFVTFGDVAPMNVDVRGFRSVSQDGTPDRPPSLTISCDPRSSDPTPCRPPREGGTPQVALDLGSTGTQFVSVEGYWYLPDAMRSQYHLPAGVQVLRAAWLFAVSR
jgi:hypothetical protein